MLYSPLEKKAIAISALGMASVWGFNLLSLAGLL